jgi:hypothetical protein
MKEYLNYYLILLIILSLGALSFYFLRFNIYYQSLVLVLTSFFYVIWGIVHHWLSGDLHLKVVLEYVLIAILANLVILSLLFRA